MFLGKNTFTDEKIKNITFGELKQIWADMNDPSKRTQVMIPYIYVENSEGKNIPVMYCEELVSMCNSGLYNDDYKPFADEAAVEEENTPSTEETPSEEETPVEDTTVTE